MNLGRMISPLLLLLLLAIAAAAASSSSIATPQDRLLQFALDAAAGGTDAGGGVPEFRVPEDFYTGKCDPCVARTEYTIRAIVHGTANDIYWQHVQTAMQQASRDTAVRLEMELHPPGGTADEISARMAAQIRRATLSRHSQQQEIHALIVSVPSTRVLQAAKMALEMGLPVFGFSTGYQAVQQIPLLGFVAQDEELAGQRVAETILERMKLGTARQWNAPLEDENNTEILLEEDDDEPVPSLWEEQTIQRVLFVNHDSEATEDSQMARYRGLQSTLVNQQVDPSTEIQVTQIFVDLDDVFSAARSLESLAFLNCKYNYVVLGASDFMEISLSALENSGCQDSMDILNGATGTGTQLAAFGSVMGPDMVEALMVGKLAFAAAPQHYIESVFAVVMASMFVTTGKKLALPTSGSNIYLSGPVMITKDNIPTDSQQRCLEQAFPVCDPMGNPWDLISTTANSETADLCNSKGCLPRDVIRIGGVLHGVSSDLFWDPVFAAARQAASDVGVVLELEQLDAQKTPEIVHAKMAARIQNLCESGVDGIFVTIPSDMVSGPCSIYHDCFWLL